eukprot:gene25243-27317_t
MKVTLARYRLSELQHILAADDDILSDEAKSLEVRQDELKKYHEAYKKNLTKSAEKTLSQEFDQTFVAYVAEDKKIIALSAAKKKEEARDLIRVDSTLLYRRLNMQIDKMVASNEAGSMQSNMVAIVSYAAARIWIITFLAGSEQAETLEQVVSVFKLGVARVVAQAVGSTRSIDITPGATLSASASPRLSHEME